MKRARMKTINELTLCTYCWCMTKSIEHEDIGDVVCAKCGEYKRKIDESNDDKTPMPYSAVFGAILKKEGDDAED